MLMGTPELVTHHQSRSAAQRRRNGWGLLDAVMLGYLTCLAVGAATVYAVQPGSSVVRIDRSMDAVYVGDLVAVHR